MLSFTCIFSVFVVDFFVDAGPLSPDPTLVGKKEIYSQISILSVDFLFSAFIPL